MDDLRPFHHHHTGDTNTIVEHGALSGYGANQSYDSGTDDEWSNFEDDDTRSSTSIEGEDDDVEDLLPGLIDDESPSLNKAPLPARKSSYVLPSTRQSAGKPTRLKSRARQKAQNAKAGIKLVTDTAQFRRQQQPQQQQHIAFHLKHSAEPSDTRKGRFADPAALQALEGDQSQSSVGSLHWLKKHPSEASSYKANMSPKPGMADSRRSDLSPDDRPIMIGIAIPSNDLGSRVVSPLTSTTDSPVNFNSSLPGAKYGHTRSPELRSHWSPDTAYSADSPYTAASSRVASSVYSQPGTIIDAHAPPMPAIPSSFKNKKAESNDDDNASVDTEFEGITPVTTRNQSTRSKGHARSPAVTIAPLSGYWGLSPFQQNNSNPWAESMSKPGGELQLEKSISSPQEQSIGLQPEQSTTPSESKAKAVQSELERPVESGRYYQGVDEKKGAAFFAQSPAEPAWYDGADEKNGAAYMIQSLTPQNLAISTTAANSLGSPRGRAAPSPTIASSSRLTPVLHQSPQHHAELRTRDVSQAPSQRAQLTGGSNNSAGAQSHSEKARIMAEENTAPTPADMPPPYSASPQQAKKPIPRYHAVLPPERTVASRFPPSPGPESPGLGHTMTSQSAIPMTRLANVPLTPPPARLAHSQRHKEGERDAPLPDRALGTFVPGDHFHDTLGNTPAAQVERRRRRHEKEDAVARKIGGFWRGRGCIPETGCFGRMGREGRKRRRIWLGAIGGFIAVIILVVLVVVLLRKTAAPVAEEQGPTIWLNLTDFPPIPTGVLSVVGAENSEDASTCIFPETMWSCSLPPDQSAANLPYLADQLTFALQIQFDNSTDKAWNVPDGKVPTPTPQAPKTTTAAPRPTSTVDQTKVPNNNRRSLIGRTAVGVRNLLRLPRDSATAKNASKSAFTPSPAPPAFEEMWFLGNTTDFIVSDRKAGEATPFFITFLPSLNSPVGPNMLPIPSPAPSSTSAPPAKAKRAGTGDAVQSIESNLTSGKFIEGILPTPPRNADGTGKPATLFPHPVQQPLRLYDRGLDTEHYGFYTYFNKTIYLKSINDASDADGGSNLSDANQVALWAWTRFHVQIWTRRETATRLNKADTRSAVPGTAEEAMTAEQLLEVRRPGTFPYPITISEDTHGGDPGTKSTLTFMVRFGGRIDLEKFGISLNFMDLTTELINSRANYNPSFGGIDGGHGGCKCAWTNFVGLDGKLLSPGNPGR